MNSIGFVCDINLGIYFWRCCVLIYIYKYVTWPINFWVEKYEACENELILFKRNSMVSHTSSSHIASSPVESSSFFCCYYVESGCRFLLSQSKISVRSMSVFVVLSHDRHSTWKKSRSRNVLKLHHSYKNSELSQVISQMKGDEVKL